MVSTSKTSLYGSHRATGIQFLIDKFREPQLSYKDSPVLNLLKLLLHSFVYSFLFLKKLSQPTFSWFNFSLFKKQFRNHSNFKNKTRAYQNYSFLIILGTKRKVVLVLVNQHNIKNRKNTFSNEPYLFLLQIPKRGLGWQNPIILGQVLTRSSIYRKSNEK